MHKMESGSSIVGIRHLSISQSSHVVGQMSSEYSMSTIAIRSKRGPRLVTFGIWENNQQADVEAEDHRLFFATLNDFMEPPSFAADVISFSGVSRARHAK